ncbi:MAG: CPBP family intramembrane metalloprotease [Algoriphagus sp.]|nr:CPBP family intramembrane metalloprotease [Algoriphagus sp.]
MAPILIAPVIEELLFRGFLSRSKVVRALFLLLGVGALFFFNFHWVLVIFILLTYVVYLSYFYTKIEWLLDVAILLSAFVFGSVHYSADELNFLQTLPFFLVQFSGGLILSWVIYTKNFLSGVISHAVWNLIIVGISLYGLQFVDTTASKAAYGQSILVYEKVPIFHSSVSSFKIEDQELIAKNMTVFDVVKYMDERYLDTFNITTPYMKYDIHISLKGTPGRSDFNSNAMQLLEQEKLLIKRDSVGKAFVWR